MTRWELPYQDKDGWMVADEVEITPAFKEGECPPLDVQRWTFWHAPIIPLLVFLQLIILLSAELFRRIRSLR